MKATNFVSHAWRSQLLELGPARMEATSQGLRIFAEHSRSRRELAVHLDAAEVEELKRVLASLGPASPQPGGALFDASAQADYGAA